MAKARTEEQKLQKRLYDQFYNQTHRAKINKRRRAYHATHREEINERQQRWREAHREEYGKYMQQYREAHREEIKKRQLKYKYNLTSQEFDLLWGRQNGLCAVCERPLMKAYVDHIHPRGKVRGILCPSCNWMIGLAKENPETLKRAAEYLKTSILERPPLSKVTSYPSYDGQGKLTEDSRNG